MASEAGWRRLWPGVSLAQGEEGTTVRTTATSLERGLGWCLGPVGVLFLVLFATHPPRRGTPVPIEVHLGPLDLVCYQGGLNMAEIFALPMLLTWLFALSSAYNTTEWVFDPHKRHFYARYKQLYRPTWEDTPVAFDAVRAIATARREGAGKQAHLVWHDLVLVLADARRLEIATMTGAKSAPNEGRGGAFDELVKQLRALTGAHDEPSVAGAHNA